MESEVLSVLRSGQIAQGTRVASLETQIAEMLGVDHVIAVGNGTAALIAGLRSLGLPAGSEVITSPFTFVATVNACLSAGLKVRFADIGLSDFGMDPDAAAKAVTDDTRCLLPVHLYGQTADLAQLADLAASRDLRLVEDAAQALMARFDGRPAGTWGTGCFSLYATKNLTSGEGGLISTNDPDQAAWLRAFRNQGMVERYVYEILGDNLRMTDLQAAVALPQLPVYDERVAARRRNSDLLRDGLAGVEGLTLPGEIDGRFHVWHQFTVLVDETGPIDREMLAAALAEQGIGSGVYYPRLLGEYPHIRDDGRVALGETPNAAHAARSCLSLPVHPKVTENDIEHIVSTVRSAFEQKP